MTLGLYAIRTVSTPPVFARDIPIAQPRPRMSMIEDAERCNARLRKAWGHAGNETVSESREPSCQSHNKERAANAHARNVRMAEVFASIIREHGPQKIRQLAAATGLTDNVADAVIRHMKKTGMATSNRGRTMGWRLIETESVIR
jgi:hypothetical protein